MWVHMSPKETVTLNKWDYISIFHFANFVHITSHCIYCMFVPYNLLIFTVYVRYSPPPPQHFLFQTDSNQKSSSLLQTSVTPPFRTLSIFFPLLKTTARGDLFPSGQLDAEPWNTKMSWDMLFSPLCIVQFIFSYPGAAPITASEFLTQADKIQLGCTGPADSSRDGQKAERWCYQSSW